MHLLRPLNSTDPETIPFDQRLGRRIFPPVNLGQSNLRLFKFLASLGLQTSNLGQCGTASSVVQKESPCTVFFYFIFSATLQNFLFKQVCSRHTMRVQAQGEQLHQAHLVIHCSYIPSYMCFGAFCYCDYTHYFFCLFFVTIHITIVTHKSTSEQIHHHCHTVLPALTLLAILPLQLHCSHTHTQKHGTLTHLRNELDIRKS